MSESEQRLLMLIDQDPAQCRLISALAAREGWRTLLVKEPNSAVAMLGRRQGLQLDAVCVDLAAAGNDACVIIAELRSRRPTLAILTLAESTSFAPAIEALRAGATDFLLKPVLADRLTHSLRVSTQRETWGDELAPLSEKPSAQTDFEAMIGAAPNFRAALAVAAKAARSHAPVLIEGEPGAGKEMLVRAMHAASMRSKAPLRVVNAGCTPANSIESVLFGHEKDAFPGAFDRHIGAIQQSDGGTLVVDEIERLSMPVQERLLEAVSNGGVRPVGGQHSVRVDVRLIAASNQSLRDLAAQGKFLPQLLDLVAPVTVVLPPLRERSVDVPALARHFLARIGEHPGLSEIGVTDGALALLTAYEWPGNVRQLYSTLFRAAVFCEGDALTTSDFPTLSARLCGERPAAITAPTLESAGVMLYTQDGNLRPLEEIEGDVIRLAIGLYRGRMTEVARRLGIGRSTLYRKLSELGIDNAA